jgi:hypothetical protein
MFQNTLQDLRAEAGSSTCVGKHMLEGSHNANELGKRPRYSTHLSASVDSSAVSMVPVSVNSLDGEEERREAAPSGKEQVPISTDSSDDEEEPRAAAPSGEKQVSTILDSSDDEKERLDTQASATQAVSKAAPTVKKSHKNRFDRLCPVGKPSSQGRDPVRLNAQRAKRQRANLLQEGPYPNPSLPQPISTPTHPYPNPSLPQPIPGAACSCSFGREAGIYHS